VIFASESHMGTSVRLDLLLVFTMFIAVHSFQKISSLSSHLRAQFTRGLTTHVIVVGKKNGGEPWISDGCAEYEKRLKPVLNIQTTFLKSDEEQVKAADAFKGVIIALDENGKQYTSPQFTDLFYSSLEKGGANVAFLIGGFDGLPHELKSKYPLISLSKLTWTHSMARLLLMEQIYRATEIRKGSAYHKA
jgi:23S rRNA (pseudouridine1915-N3)-methyltransferase